MLFITQLYPSIEIKEVFDYNTALQMICNLYIHAQQEKIAILEALPNFLFHVHINNIYKEFYNGVDEAVNSIVLIEDTINGLIKRLQAHNHKNEYFVVQYIKVERGYYHIAYHPLKHTMLYQMPISFFRKRMIDEYLS